MHTKNKKCDIVDINIKLLIKKSKIGKEHQNCH